MPYGTAELFKDTYGADYTVRLLASLEEGASRDTDDLLKLLSGTAPDGADEEALQRGIDRLTGEIDHRSDLVDSYLRQAATLPLDADVLAASPIISYTLDIVRFYLCTAPTMRTELVEKDYEIAMRWFRDVAKGIAVLEKPDGVTTPVTPAVGRKTIVYTSDLMSKM